MKSLHECHVRHVTYRCMQHVWSYVGVRPCMYGAGVVVENVARCLQLILSCRLLEGSRFEERMHWYAAYRVFLLSRMSCRSLVCVCVAKTMEDRRRICQTGHACKYTDFVFFLAIGERDSRAHVELQVD